MTYYKATRPDGTSFHDGKTAWTVGETVKIKSRDRRKTLCGVGILHAADAPAETLVGGSWPCRLFEVEGTPVAQKGHKFGFHELTVIRELPAWQALGPNGEAVAALIERCKTITPEEAGALGAARGAARGAAARAVAARGAAQAAARGAARGAAGDAAQAAARGAAARAVAWGAAAWGAAWDAARDAARDAAAWDAAVALVVRDLISEEQFQTLYGPWASVREAME